MGIMTNRNNRSAKLIFFLLALAVLAGFQLGFTETQDIGQLRKAAMQGDVDAQFDLGYMYANGEGVPEDDQEAVRWYRKAAKQGDASAQYNLGVMYGKGEGVPEDVPMEAVRSGIARRPSRDTPRLNTTWASCTARARECRRTTERR